MWHVRSRDTQGRGQPTTAVIIFHQRLKRASATFPPGILFTQGEEHTEQRRIALKSLKDFGYGMKSFENIVTAEISSFLLRMENSVGGKVRKLGRLLNLNESSLCNVFG